MHPKIKFFLKSNYPQFFVKLLNLKKIITLFFTKKKNFLSLNPVSSIYGLDRGTPIDRYYINNFITKNSQLIKGKILEVGDDRYSQNFKNSILSVDVLTKDIDENIKKNLDTRSNYFFGDFEQDLNLKNNYYDCLILTQVFQCIYKIETAIKNAFKTLKSGGSCLITLPGINQNSAYDADRYGDYWRFTIQSAKKIFEVIESEIKDIEVNSYGNVLVASNFLYGLSYEEIKKKNLTFKDLNYPIIITIKITKK